jgi:hypothetical protein
MRKIMLLAAAGVAVSAFGLSVIGADCVGGTTVVVNAGEASDASVGPCCK